jgi:endoglucanase
VNDASASEKRRRWPLARLLSSCLLGSLAWASTGCGYERPNIAQVPAHQPGENPFRGHKLYVDPSMPSVKQAKAWRAQRPEDAALLDKIARQPQAEWLGEWSGAVKLFVRQKMKEYAAVDAMGLFVVYAIPDRDCGQHSRGGAKNAAAYLEWIDKIAAGVDDGKAVMILEPDALGLLEKCSSKAKYGERYQLLTDAVRIFKARPNVHVYLDAGNARWVAPEQMAQHLKAGGLAYADGFSLNVSNYVATDETLAYGKQISALTGGAHFVIDTARNGNGAAPGDEWCNPDGRALGIPPTADTDDPLCDAYLWLKRPGESDGACNGGPRAGQWWPAQALGMAKRAKY